jgi:hypothetical protein
MEYAIRSIPQETRERMGDTDWVGVEWILRGMIVLLIAVVLALVPAMLWVIRRVLRKNVLN